MVCCMQNFALQLEYLEGEFYSCASTGSGLPAELRGGGPASTGCQKANLGSAVGDVAAELAANEKTHVRPCPHLPLRALMSTHSCSPCFLAIQHTELTCPGVLQVTLLRNALGSAATPIPQIDLGNSFAAAANAAFGMTLSPPFSPYTNDLFFLTGAFIFEDVGESLCWRSAACSGTYTAACA